MNRLLLRWSWRDLRGHWVAVIAIALVIAIGTGVYAGLGSTATWRRESNDASFAATRIHDLRVELTAGTFVAEGTLRDAALSIPDADAITGAVERLVVDSQIDASTPLETILVRARLVGMSFDDPHTGDPTTVDDVWIRDGREPSPTDIAPTMVLEAKFADFYDLPETGTLLVAGGQPVEYVGLGVGPEEFFVSDPSGGFFAQGEYAVVYTTLPAAQELTGRPGMVNDLVVTLADGADRDAVEAQLREAMDALPDVSARVTTTDDVEAFTLLYDDIENDQQIWNMISALVLLAAALAAFNLVTRIVESQRREIGIGMALGVARSRLAVRPILVGIQIGVLGTIAGIGVGVLVGSLMKGLMESLVPLPEWRTPFQYDVYAQAAVLGLGIPLAAAALPVWRAVRVEPIQAIRTGHLTARSSRLTDWTNRFDLPGRSLTHLPIRNVLRNPRRAILTAIGVGAAITALVAVMGMLDSFTRSIDRGADEVTKGDPDRVLVALDSFYEFDSEEVTTLRSDPAIGDVDLALRGVATAITGDPDDEFELLIELLDLDTAGWTPTIIEGQPTGEGLILAEKAADDLGVGPGDTIPIRLAVVVAGELATVDRELRVDAVHPNPIRTFTYGDLALAEQLGFGGQTNLVHVYPAEGVARAELQRAVFGLPGVASSQAVARVSEIFDEALEQFVGILLVMAGFVLVLAVLIAFNSSRITVEERRREHATMRAFGLPVRSVMGVVIKESVVIGVAATAIGLVAGTLALSWMLNSLAERTLPDFGISVYLAPRTLLISLVVGVVAVAVSPLFLVRRVRRMDIPDTLRVME